MKKTQSEPEKKFWKKWWFWVITVFVLFIIIGVGSEDPKTEPVVQEEEEIEEIEEIKDDITEVVFNVPEVVGLDAFEIIETKTQTHEEPDIFNEPTNDSFGTVNWTDQETKIMFGFDYYADGSIADNTLSIVGAREDGHTANSVLQAGNLKRDAENYEIQDESGDLIVNIWILLKDQDMDREIEEKEDEIVEPPKEIEEDTETVTIGQRNALRAAKSYLEYTAFSHSGLIEQLKFEGFSYEEAKYGADNSGANWNEQAAKSAEAYLEYTAFSRSGLIEQLKFEGFTSAQAEYGVEAVGY